MMHVFPQSGIQKLGFDVIQRRVHDLLRTEQGIAFLESLPFLSASDDVRRQLETTDEIRSAIQFDDAVPHAEVSDVSLLLEQIGPVGSFLDGTELLEIRRLAVTFTSLKEYFRSRIEKYPAACKVFDGVQLDESFAHLLGERLDADGNVADNASPDLRKIRKEKEGYERELQRALSRELKKAQDAGFAAEGQPTIRGGRHVIPVKAEGKRKVSGFIHDVSATGQTVFIEPSSCLDLNNELRTLEARERAEIVRILTEMTSRVRENRPSLVGASQAIGVFDVFFARAVLALQIGGEVPLVSDSAELSLIDARNPLLQLYFKEGDAEREVVPLNLELKNDCNTLVISGPNAGGKTVALKTTGLILLMLSSGIPVPLDPRSRVCIPRKLFVDIGDEQSLEEDLSSYSSHLSLMKKVVAEADPTTLVLIDEIGAATDPDQGSAMALATLEALSATGCRTIVTTHFGRLKVAAESAKGFCNASMEFDAQRLVPTYNFIQGLPGSSYAMEIATRVGLSDDLIKRARQILGSQESSVDELISKLEKEKLEVDQLSQKLRVEMEDASSVKKRYEAKMDKQKEAADQIRRVAIAESQKLLRDSRAEIERTIREIREAGADKKATRKTREQLQEFVDKVDRKALAIGEVEQTPPHSPDPIVVGDMVVVDGGSAAAEVESVEKDKITVIAGSGRFTVDRNRVRKVGRRREQRVEIRSFAGDQGLASLSASHKIDLRGDRVEEALGKVMTFVDRAVASSLKEAHILHGTGTGALRNAIREYLSTRSDVATFDDAEWESGGPGVTVITFGD